MSERWVYLIWAAMLALAVALFAVQCRQASECESRGGVLIRGFAVTGYVCVRGVAE